MCQTCVEGNWVGRTREVRWCKVPSERDVGGDGNDSGWDGLCRSPADDQLSCQLRQQRQQQPTRSQTVIHHQVVFLSSFGFYEPHRSRAFLPRDFCQWIRPQVLSTFENQRRTGEFFATLVPVLLRTRERERVFWFVHTFSVVPLSSCVILEARHCYSTPKVTDLTFLCYDKKTCGLSIFLSLRRFCWEFVTKGSYAVNGTGFICIQICGELTVFLDKLL